MKNLILHHDDLDGRACAAILNIHLKGNTECVPMSYWDKLLFFGSNEKQRKPILLKDGCRVIPVEKDQHVYIVDFSLTPEKMEELKTITENIWWYDHHITAMKYPYNEYTKGKRDLSYSASTIIWKEFFLGRSMPTILKAINHVEGFADNIKEKTLIDYEYDCVVLGGESFDSFMSPKSEEWEAVLIYNGLAEAYYRDFITLGQGISLHVERNFDLRKAEFTEKKLDGLKFLKIPFLVKDFFLIKDLMKEYDVIFSYEIKEVNGQLHCRSLLKSHKINIAEFAEKYGGGGHKYFAGINGEIFSNRFFVKIFALDSEHGK